MRRSWGWASACLLLWICGCSDVPKNAVCRAHAPTSYSASGHVSGSDWIQVLLSDQTEEKDCSGEWLELPRLPDRCPLPKMSPRTKPAPSAAENVVVREHGDGFVLVWAPTQKFDNGDGGGVVGLVHLSKKDFSVVAIGMLRLPLGGVGLKMAKVQGEELLLAHGSNCSEGQAARACEHVLEVLVLDRGRFRPVEMRDRENRCLGGTQLDLRRVEMIKLDRGWVRQFALNASYEVSDGGLEVQEQLVVTDFPKGGDEGQGRLFRRSQGRRKLEFTGAYFISSEPSLWSKTRPTRGELD